MRVLARAKLMCNSAAHNSRPARESLKKRLGRRTTRALETRDAGRCVYCQRDAAKSGAHLHLDHLTPKSEGGADEPTNLVHACRRCNSARQALSLEAWAVYAAAKFGLTFSADAVRAHARSLP